MKTNGNEISTKMNKRRRNEIENLFILAKKHNVAHLIIKGDDIEFIFWDPDNSEKVNAVTPEQVFDDEKEFSKKKKEDQELKERLELELWSSGR